VSISDTELMAIGGTSNDVATARTQIYNLVTDSWSEGPELSAPSWLPSCGVVDWGEVVGRVVVVFGGPKRVELLYLNDLNSGWQPGPDLPVEACCTDMVQYKDSVILVGGEGQIGVNMYQLKSPEGPWIEMEQTLAVGASYQAFILIPDELTGC
jgi:hypothetical protein